MGGECRVSSGAAPHRQVRYHYSLRLRTLLGHWEIKERCTTTSGAVLLHCFEPSARARGWRGFACWRRREPLSLCVCARSRLLSARRGVLPCDSYICSRLSCRGQIQAGSLTGAVHLSNDNAGVLRPAQGDQNSPVEHKGLSWLDLDFQYEYSRRKPGLSILLTLSSL